MNDQSKQVGVVFTEVDEAQGGNSSSPGVLYPSLRISETESSSTTQRQYHQPYALESHAPQTHETPLQASLQLETGASNSETTADPQSEVPQLLPSSSTKQGKRPLSDSLGRGNAAVVIGGVITSCATIGFLIILWAGQGPTSDGQHASYA
ncbi:hypothetical protein RRF57_006638 [Xylaria bambusicola]|uniref:Uncharacterized protein n=1 Tax=Xylaria bambusicola TaxID=326684 RepID=A0AAN7Z9D0_9PEZI